MDRRIGIAMKMLCFCHILFMKSCGSSLKCCFKILENRSVSYHLSEPVGEYCTPTWSAMDIVVVDEEGNTVKSKVVYHEPQKLILKGNMEANVKEVTYRKDCLHTGLTFTAECHDPCADLDVPTTTQAPYINTTQATGGDHKMAIYIVVGTIVIIIIIIIIIIIVICLRRNKGQASNGSFGKAVPKKSSVTRV